MSQALPEVAFSTFAGLDLRVGRVVEVAPFPAARNPAYQIGVDFGPLGRRWTSARVTNYPPEDLTGRLVVGAVNIGSRRIAGFISEFLLLGAIGADGTVRLVHPDPGASPGERIG